MIQLNDWLSIDKTSGEGDATITLTANSSTSLRKKIYGLKIKGVSKNVFMNVIQDAFLVDFKLNSYEIESQQEGGVFTNAVTSNIPWFAEVKNSWITMDVEKGESGHTAFTITIDEYGYEREGEVVFMGYEGDVLATLKVIQLGDIRRDLFWIELENDGEITPLKRSVRFSFDGVDWFKSEELSVKKGQRVYSRTERFDTSFIGFFSFSTQGKVGGDLSGFYPTLYEFINDYNCFSMFSRFFLDNVFLTDASELILPWGDLTEGGEFDEEMQIDTAQTFMEMFKGCTSLVNGPKRLPATTLASSCYSNMFEGCTSLVNAPELPATTLAYGCYWEMFKGCTSLVGVPNFNIYSIKGVSCKSMFEGCTSLVNVPLEINISVLWERCFEGMFEGCTSLTTSPIIKVLTPFIQVSFVDMFYGCTSLSYINMQIQKWDEHSFTDWVAGVSPTGTFVKHPIVDIPFGVNGIPEGWTVKEAIDKRKDLFWVEFEETDGVIGVGFNRENKYVDDIDAEIWYSFDGDNWEKAIYRNSETANYLIYLEENRLVYLKNESLILNDVYANNGTISFNKNAKIGGDFSSMARMYDYTAKYAFKDNIYLTDASELILPWRELEKECYAYMFKGCTSLVNAPKLPALTLAYGCYESMFEGCTSLVTAPELDFTTIAEDCCVTMFKECNSLSYIKIAFKGEWNEMPFLSWLKNVSPTGTFVKDVNIEIPYGESGIPYGWGITPSFIEKDFWIELEEDGEIYGMDNNILYCRADDTYWNACTESLQVEGGVKYYFFNKKSTCDIEGINFSVRGNIGGDLTSIAGHLGECDFGNLFKNNTNLIDASELIIPYKDFDFYYGCMFEGCTSLVGAPKLLPTMATERCYYRMFKDCISLVNAPELPAFLAKGCYEGMFEGCTSLVNAPELLTETLREDCYKEMFKGCTNLSYIKMYGTYIYPTSLTSWVEGVANAGLFDKKDVEIPIGVNGIPSGWVVYNEGKPITDGLFWIELEEDGRVTGLTDYSKYSYDGLVWTNVISPLSVEGNRKVYIKTTSTTSRTIGFSVNGKVGGDLSSFKQDNYRGLFKGNTYLTDASELILPWEDLTKGGKSFSSMFEGCTSLVNGPLVLPAIILNTYCYQFMFNGCSSLVNAPKLPATRLVDNCYYSMFEGCTSLVTAPVLPATTLASSCYGSMFNGCTNLSYIKILAINIDYSAQMRFWVKGVSPNGTFVKHPNANIPFDNYSGIPEGWTVETATE